MISGNTTATIQVKSASNVNQIGEKQPSWATAFVLKGWLDMMSGNAETATYNAKIESSTHVFIADYAKLNGVTAENSRAVINGQRYDVTFIDDPMGLHKHLEIFLKLTGGQ